MKCWIAIILMIPFLFANCAKGRSDAWQKMSEADRLIEEHPNSALAILAGIKDYKLSDKEERARYALLMSMALDKNYIDTTSFEVLQPAVDFYISNGTPDEKLKTYYYQGRIYQNAKDVDKAMKAFVNAIDLSTQITDSLTLARALVAQACLYDDLYAFEKSYNNYMNAAYIYGNLNKKNYKIDCLMRSLNNAIVLKNKLLADSVLTLYKDFELNHDYQRVDIQRQKVLYAIAFCQKKEIKTTIDRYAETLSDDNLGLLALANAYNKIGDNKNSLDLLSRVHESGMDYDTLKYLAISTYVHNDIGHFDTALSNYMQFTHLNDSIDLQVFSEHANDIEDKHSIELEAKKNSHKKSSIIWNCAIIITILIFTILILVMIVKRNRAKNDLIIKREQAKILENEILSTENQNLIIKNENLQLENNESSQILADLSHRIEELEIERESLKNLMSNNTTLSTAVSDAIKVRMEMLNSLLASLIADNEKYKTPFDEWTKNIKENATKFMESNHLALKVSHPNFIKYLENHNLSKDEINYVCLYAIGLRGKDIGVYIHKRSHVNVSSSIRKKLGLERNDTNLGIYVRKLFKEL